MKKCMVKNLRGEFTGFNKENSMDLPFSIWSGR